MNIQSGFRKRLLLVLFAAVIAVCFYTISQVHRVPLMENGGRSFIKAQVVSIVQDHEQAGDIYIGDQKVTHVTGYNVSDIENLIYVQEETGIQVGELLFAGILIAALGAVMNVSMSISSTLQELYDQNPTMTARQLFRSGMTVGRDMMGTMSNTLILAFVGGSINTIVMFYAYDYEYLQLINLFDMAIEIMQGISASMGVILTVPLVSFIGAWMIANRRRDIS